MNDMKSPKITMLQDRVLIKVQNQDMILNSGIILPKTTKQYPEKRGIVISVGIDFDDRINPGDVVIYRDDSGVMVEWEGEEYEVVRESSILAFETPRALDPFRGLELLRQVRAALPDYQELLHMQLDTYFKYEDNALEDARINP